MSTLLATEDVIISFLQLILGEAYAASPRGGAAQPLVNV